MSRVSHSLHHVKRAAACVVAVWALAALGACDEHRAAIDLPPAYEAGALLCTCQCGTPLERVDTPAFEVCLPPERLQRAQDGESYSRREVHDLCAAACASGVTQGARGLACEQGEEPCRGPLCVDCVAAELEADTFVVEGVTFEDVVDGGNVDAGLVAGWPAQARFGLGRGDSCKADDGAQQACDVENCAMDEVFTPTCGDGVLQQGEACDGACGTFPPTCDTQFQTIDGVLHTFRGVPRCSDDCEEIVLDSCEAFPAWSAPPSTPAPVCPSREARLRDLVHDCARAFSSCGRMTCTLP